MSVNKNALPTEGSPKTVTSNCGGGKTISTVQTYKHGVVTVVEFVFSDASSNFIKFGSNGTLEMGGTLELGTGTPVKW
jgi:hypothetical protein